MLADEVPNFGRARALGWLSDVTTASQLSQQYGLLNGDALVVAVMQTAGLSSLASNDADFDRVPWINRFAPA